VAAPGQREMFRRKLYAGKEMIREKPKGFVSYEAELIFY